MALNGIKINTAKDGNYQCSIFNSFYDQHTSIRHLRLAISNFVKISKTTLTLTDSTQTAEAVITELIHGEL